MAVGLLESRSPGVPVVPEEALAEDVFTAQLAENQEALKGYVASLLPGDCEVPDVVQKANLVIWRKRDKFESGTNFRAWALSIAYWESRAWMTSCKRKGWLSYREELVDLVDQDGPRDFSSNCARSESIEALRQCLDQLPEADRHLIVQFYMYGRSVAECSEIFGRSREAIKSQLHRVRATLRRGINSRLASTHERSWANEETTRPGHSR